MPMSRAGSNGCVGEPILTSPESMGMKPGENLEQRRLAATGRTDQGHELARLDVEGRLRNGEQGRPARAVSLLHAGKVDERFAHGSGRERQEMRASRGTSRCSSASTMA
jgi:hypothetical protein